MKITFSGQIPGNTIIIDQATLLSGVLIDPARAPMTLRPIEALGVNSRRFQEVGRRSDPLVFETYRASADIERMETIAAITVGKLVSLRVISPTRSAPYIFNDTLITSVSTIRRSGKLHGIGANASAPFTLVQQWVFEI